MLRQLRFPLIGVSFLTLLVATWAGLIRLGWGWPAWQPGLPLAHGPLMVSGFLGTVIGLERAVALSGGLLTSQKRPWVIVGPILTGLGALALIAGLREPSGPLLMTLGSLGLVAVFGLILRRQLALYTVTMALGALLWLAGNSLWLSGRPIYSVVPWWSGFLILTIAGERLELGRVLRPPRQAQSLFAGAVGLLVVGLVVSLFSPNAGARLSSLSLLGLALWLWRYDVARYTVRKAGLTRFIALCLLTGYGWLALAGGLGLVYGGTTGGFYYDAIQHAIFVGFVLSMIFGHAPIIFPAITGRPIPFQPVFYAHLILLHLSLLLRVVGDLFMWLPARQWGGLLNGLALLVFLLNTARAARNRAL